MANLQALVHALVLLGLALSCTATTYTVGDNSGWDISSDLESWPVGKKFVVGDVLLFQYSSSNSVNEVTKENFDGCNTTKYLQTWTNGNSSVPLTTPGMIYFVSGNQLYCLGGMKLQVNVQNNANSTAGAPLAGGPSSMPQPTSKSNDPSTTSSGFVHGGRDPLVLAFIGFMAAVLWMV
ncbi:hypothetical protein L1049_020195 [Liquidambar formosana]|uniref:Phytocyanin domain-containing protein n=1 Tax=Liquidambar formosana TaxID=63359 RepID=A0AAP0SCE4_LIQFO